MESKHRNVIFLGDTLYTVESRSELITKYLEGWFVRIDKYHYNQLNTEIWKTKIEFSIEGMNNCKQNVHIDLAYVTAWWKSLNAHIYPVINPFKLQIERINNWFNS